MDGIFFLGQLLLIPYNNYTPSGVVLCDGRSLSVNQNQALYSLIGNKFGGNTTNFNVPDLRNAAPIPGVVYYMVTSGMYPERP